MGTLTVLPKGIDRYQADQGLIASGSISFDAGDDLTVEKKTSAISIPSGLDLHPDSLWLIAIDKPQEDTAGDLTVNIYNVIKIDNNNSRDVLIATFTVQKTTGARTCAGFLLQGLFVGEGDIKIGMKFATDSGAITVYYKLFRL